MVYYDFFFLNELFLYIFKACRARNHFAFKKLNPLCVLMLLDVTRVFLQKFLLRLCQGTFQSSRAEQKRKQVDLEKGRNIPELLVQFIISDNVD